MYNEYRPSGFNFLPPVVKNLIILNAIIYLAQELLQLKFGLRIEEKMALYHFSSPLFHLYQYITYMFLHGNLAHIFFNMFAVWMFGNVLENVWGSKRFLIYYLVTGIGAALVHGIYTYYKLHSLQDAAFVYAGSPGLDEFEIFIREHVPGYYKQVFMEFLDRWTLQQADTTYLSDSVDMINYMIARERDIPTVGASGAVYGVLLAFGMLFPNTLIYLYFAIPIKAKYIVIIYGMIELFQGISMANDNIAHFAHLGGMLFGFLFIKYWGKY